jgi:serine/threonine-protein kinase
MIDDDRNKNDDLEKDPDLDKTHIIKGSKPTSMPETIFPNPALDQSVEKGQNTLSTATILPVVEEGESGLKLVFNTQKRYDFYKRIGEGGSGEVELALDKDISRLVAIKKLKRELHDPSMVLRFVHEIRTVGHLEHPNIVPIHDVGRDENGQYYFVMKYVVGESLFSILEKLRHGDPVYHRRYSFQYRMNLFAEILNALAFAHHNGIIHRDIKPANIMIGPHGEVMVMDWGIAKRIREKKGEEIHNKILDQLETTIRRESRQKYDAEELSLTQNNTLLGTPAYMAPEQVSVEIGPQDERTDVYALSVLFYELLSLKSYLSRTNTLQSILKGVLEEKPKLAMMIKNPHQPSVPADLSHFVAKGMKKQPEDRFQSVAEMQERLQQIVEGYAPVQCPFTLSKRILRSLEHMVNNSPMIGVFLLMILLMLMVGGIMFFIRLF